MISVNQPYRYTPAFVKRQELSLDTPALLQSAKPHNNSVKFGSAGDGKLITLDGFDSELRQREADIRVTQAKYDSFCQKAIPLKKAARWFTAFFRNRELASHHLANFLEAVLLGDKQIVEGQLRSAHDSLKKDKERLSAAKTDIMRIQAMLEQSSEQGDLASLLTEENQSLLLRAESTEFSELRQAGHDLQSRILYHPGGLNSLIALLPQGHHNTLQQRQQKILNELFLDILNPDIRLSQRIESFNRLLVVERAADPDCPTTKKAMPSLVLLRNEKVDLALLQAVVETPALAPDDTSEFLSRNLIYSEEPNKRLALNGLLHFTPESWAIDEELNRLCKHPDAELADLANQVIAFRREKQIYKNPIDVNLSNTPTAVAIGLEEKIKKLITIYRGQIVRPTVKGAALMINLVSDNQEEKNQVLASISNALFSEQRLLEVDFQRIRSSDEFIQTLKSNSPHQGRILVLKNPDAIKSWSSRIEKQNLLEYLKLMTDPQTTVPEVDLRGAVLVFNSSLPLRNAFPKGFDALLNRIQSFAHSLKL